MKAWYNSEKRFTEKIVRSLDKQGKNYNAGNVLYFALFFPGTNLLEPNTGQKDKSSK